AHVLQSQAQNTGQSLSIPGPNQSQTRQQTLTPGIQNNLASAAVQGSASLASIVPSINGLSQSMSSVGQTSNLQSMSAISLNMVNNSGQGISPNVYANSQRQIQGKQQQQPLVSQQPPQNPHLYQQQLQQQQMLKAKLSHSTLMQSQLHQQHQQQQQQPLSSATQLQPSQQPIMQMTSSLQSSQTSLQQAQPPLMQSVAHSGHQQSQPNLLQQPSSLPQQHHASLRQQQSQPSTHLQASSLQQQSASITQQPGLPLQQQPQLLGNQSNISNMQQSQLLGQQNSIPDVQQQRRLAVQQNNLMSMQQSQQMLNQQNMSLHQQVVPQNNISGLQQLQSQPHLQQQPQLLGSQPNMPNIHQHHQAMLMQPQKTAAQQPQQQQQQAQQTATSLNRLISLKELFQRPHQLQTMRELYYADLNEIHQRIILKCQQHEAQAQPGKPEQLESMKKIKSLMDRLLGLLQMPKSSIQPNLKEKLPYFENQMFNVIASNRRKVISPQLQGQQQIPRPGGNAQSMPQQQSSQTPPIQQLDGQGNQMSPMVQGSVPSVQSPAVSSMQNGSMTLPNHVGVPAAQQNIMNALQPSSNMDSSPSSALSSLQEGPMGSLPQGGMGSLQQATFNASTQNNMRIFQPHLPGVQRQIYHQQLKQGASFPISSPQSLQVPSPQISQHSSPQVEQGFLSSVPKAGTPLQSTNSPFVVPSPSTPLDDHEKQVSGISAVSNAANVGHQQISAAPTQGQSLAVGTPGISASPLLDEYIGSDVSHLNAQPAFTSKSNATGRPIERLVKAVSFLAPDYTFLLAS
ncbi:hypothetical protein Taro_038733, partial [Colocasia esculenta]|nr:hypothetical protein [Colocasia esculenta]